MTINIQKGQKIELSKCHEGLNNILVGLGWDPVKRPNESPVKNFLSKFFSGNSQLDMEEVVHEIDCDAFAIMLDENYKIKNRDYLIYYGNLAEPGGSVRHMGDNTTGEGEGDDEEIRIALSKVPSDVQHIVFAVTVYDCEDKKQDFGLIKGAFIRVVDDSNGKELLKYNLSERFEGKTAIIIGEVYRRGQGWKFAAIGESTADKSIGELIKRYR